MLGSASDPQLRRSRRKRKPTNEAWLTPFLAPLVSAFTKRIQSYEVVSPLNLPADGPVIVASNHTCHLDAFSIAVAVYEEGRTPRIAARSDLFRHPLLGWFLKKTGQIPIYRPGVVSIPGDKGDADSSMKEMSRVLDEGHTLVIFPESTFTRDPELWPMAARTGVARLALMHPQAKVIPVAHWGNEEIFNPYSNKISWRKIGRKRTHLKVKAGMPVDLTAYKSRDINRELLREVTDVIMEAITVQLEDLREEKARRPAWDRKINGDPYADITNARHEEIARKHARRHNIRQAFLSVKDKCIGLFRAGK